EPLRQVSGAVVRPDTVPIDLGDETQEPFVRPAEIGVRSIDLAEQSLGRCCIVFVHRASNRSGGGTGHRDARAYRTYVRPSRPNLEPRNGTDSSAASLRAMLRRYIVTLPALAMVVALAPSALAAVVVVNVSHRPRSQSEAAVAVSPLEPNDVVIASNIQRGNGIFVAVSHDAGATWSGTVLGDGDAFGRACCDPTITWDEHGNLFLAWLGYGKLRYPTVVPILLSTNGGDSWTLFDRIRPPDPRMAPRALTAPTVRASEGGPRDEEEDRGPGFIDQPTLASGPHSLWAIWNNEGQMQATGARVRALGDVGSFKPVRDVPRAYNCTFGDIAIGPGGAVAHVCQRDRDRNTPVDSVFRLTIDADGLRPGRFGPSRAIAETNVSLFEPIPAQRIRTVDAEVALDWLRAGPWRGRLVM